ncbi:MAG: beta-propeller fold lactonase family protein, partial [Planctomycetota bacterium]
VATGSFPQSVAVSGSFAYVVNYSSNTLQVFNISNPAAPTLTGSVATESNPQSVAVSGSFVYVVDYSSFTLQIFSISNPAAPTLAGSIATEYSPISVAVSGSFAYVVNSDSNTLQVFNISNPAAPTLAGSVATGSFPQSVAVSGSFAYVVNNGSNSLQVFNISNPGAITLAGSVSTGSSPYSVAVSGAFAHVVNAGANTLQVFNISNPGAITPAGSAATGNFPCGVAVSGSFEYVVNYSSSTLQVFNAAIGVGFGTPLLSSSLAGVSGSGLTGVNATQLSGQPASFYTNASNITTGTLGIAQVPNLDASKITSGTLALAQIPNLDASKITTGTLANVRTTGSNLSTPSTLVLRDASGNFAAGTITATLNGNATTATSATTATNANQLNGQSASFYTNASNLTTGTVGEAQLSSNIPRLNANTNYFTGFDQVFEGIIRVRGGIITDDYQAGWNTTDLGLYSARSGHFMRFVTSGGGFVWYSDGTVFPGGNAARMQLTSGGNLSVVGSLSKGGGSFKIDHPLDPENKFLYHSFVESPDMMNVYNGNITTDADGYATITLPDYFEALNRDFRYQLTVIDESDDMEVFLWSKVVREVKDNQFTLRSSRGNLKVSWQVTGIRKDAWAEKNRIPNSVDKPAAEKGKYLHPEAFDKPVSQSIYSSPAPVSQPGSK